MPEIYEREREREREREERERQRERDRQTDREVRKPLVAGDTNLTIMLRQMS